MRLYPGLLLLPALLAACESRPTATAGPPCQSAAGAPTLALAATRPDTADYTRPDPHEPYYPPLDTLLRLGPRRYWLSVQAVPDSTRPTRYLPPAATDTALRAEGYDGTYTFTLRDSARQRVLWRRQLHKPDLRAGGPPDLLAASEPSFHLCGYSPGLGALLFTADLSLPNSDVGYRAALLLDACTGRLRSLYGIGSSTFDASDCDPRVSPGGQAVLTCAGELLRAGRPPLRLRRPRAELAAARFLADTTLLVVYNFGAYQPAREGEMPQFVSTPAEQRAPNAFVYGTSGRVLARFKYEGGGGGMGYELGRHWLPGTRTLYLLSQGRLLLLPRARPGTVVPLPLRSLSRFRPPPRPAEVLFTLGDEENSYRFFIDTTQTQAVRYQRVTGRE